MNTNTDIRIAVSFKGHRKRRKLRMLLGAGSTDYLIDLWINTATNHPDGVLAGMSTLDVALEAGWEDDPEKFVSAMLECGFLDKGEDGTYRLHDWEDHQPFVIEAPKRSLQAQKAAEARWGKKPGKQAASKSNAQSMPTACDEHADRNAPTYLPTKEKDRVCVAREADDIPRDLPPSPEDNPDAQPRAEISSLNDCAIEFQDIAEGYRQAGGNVDVVPAYRAYTAMRRNFPRAAILADLDKRQQCDQWQRGMIPKLSNYLTNREWLNPIPAARASPAPRASPQGQHLTPKQRQTEMFKGMARALKQADGAGNGENHGGRRIEGALPAGSALPRS
jgi:hypothetical protein